MQELLGFGKKQNYTIEKNTADLTGIRDIFDGIVYKTDKSLQTIISVSPINMSLMTDKDMDALGANLTASWNREEKGFEIFSIGRSVDLDEYIKGMQGMIDIGELSKPKKDLLQDLINNANNLALRGDINSRLYYIILIQEGMGDKSIDLLKTRTDDFVRALKQFGVDAEQLIDDEITRLFMLFADDFVSTQLPSDKERLGIPMIDQSSLEYNPEKAYRDENKTKIVSTNKKKKKPEVVKVDAENEKRNGRILNMIAADGIEFGEVNFIMGNKRCQVITIESYPTSVPIGWLTNITTLQNTITKINIKVTHPDTMINGLNRSVSEFMVRAERSNNQLDKMLNEKGVEDAQELLKRISLQNEKVTYVTITILIKADTEEDLVIERKRIESLLAAKSIRPKELTFRQKDAFHSVAPYGRLSEDLLEHYGKNLPMSTIGASLPFSDAGINDITGTFLGKDAAGGIVLIDMWKRTKKVKDRNNRNWLVLGQPGTGKSTTIKMIAMQECAKGATVLVLDPEKEYLDICNYFNGQVINPMTAEGRINPFEIKDDLEYFEEDLAKKGENAEQRSHLATQMRSLRTFFKLYMDLNEEEISYLEEIIENVYEKCGITWDTDVKKVRKEQYPVMIDLYNEIKDRIKAEPDNKKLEKLRVLVRKAAKGADKEMFNGHTNGRLEADFIDINLSDLHEADASIKRTQYYNVLSWCWLQVQKAREKGKKIFLLVDEAYLLVDKDNPEALKFLMAVSKRIRKYGGGLMVISHSAVDFLEVGREGRALLSNPTYKVIMGQDGQDLIDLKTFFKLTGAEETLIENKAQGEAVFMCGSKRVHLKVLPTPYMLDVMGTAGGK